MIKELLPIGSRESISFPELGILNVPAKVDTGADSSSVWATNVIEADGKLSFTLFGMGSAYYTGDRITTDDYSVAYIRNSFGHTQERFKVKILVLIRGKRVRVELSLSDRSRNRYPMLIGKSTLRNRFSVDVRKDGIIRAKEPIRVLVMNSKDSKNVRAFFDDITAHNAGLECHFATYDDVRFDIRDETISCLLMNDGTRLCDYDLIYFKTYFQYAEVAAAMAEVAAAQGVEFIDQEVASYHAKTKLTQYVRLMRYGVMVPDSIVIPNKHLGTCYDELRTILGDRFIMKDVAGEKGESNYLVASRKEFDTVCARATKDNALYVVQRYIENDGDYRVIILDKSVELIIGRVAAGATHLTNTSKGGEARKLTKDELGAEPAGIAVRSAVIMNRQVAGVDLVFDKKNKKWLVFEVNNSPQVASGSYLEEKQQVVSRFLRKYAKK